jgi:hypothetical protein
LRGSAEKNGRNSPNTGVASYPRTLKVVIAANGASTNYLVKRLNTYVNVKFTFFIFNKFANISKNMFLLCHCGVLCIDV